MFQATVCENLAPAPKDLSEGTILKPSYFVLNDETVFVDKKLPSIFNFTLSSDFRPEYFIDLHNHVSSFNTFNFNGARTKLSHCNINVNKFRELLPSDFDDISVLQYLEYGFPLGLVEDFVLQPNLKNHSSSYEYFSHIDKFINNELEKGGITGPFYSAPFPELMISPLMTSVKKPNSRRAVFDASFGDFSLNSNTPEKTYLLDDFEFYYPKIDDFANLLINLGPGAYMWKRDLSPFFLQLPLGPTEYNKTCCIWRGSLFFFTSYVWGTRHAGMNGQRVSNLVSAIHRSIGSKENLIKTYISPDSPVTCLSPFNTLNYSDDFAGAQSSFERAQLSYLAMGNLLKALGLTDSLDKALGPSQVMTYLGIQFDSVKLEISVDPSKCHELKVDLVTWARKTTATKSDLQSILGKLIWVSKAVKFSRVFVSRIINEIKILKNQKDKIRLSNDVKKDFVWWKQFMEVFNGVQLIVPELILIQLAGDACPQGMGCFNPSDNGYFSTKFPLNFQDPCIPIHLKEFMWIIVATKLWGKLWAGKKVQLFCDNDSVCDVINNLKPKDHRMQAFLREFLYLVCKFNFHPCVSKIGTKENDLADFLSRNYSEIDAKAYFQKENVFLPQKYVVSDSDYIFISDW